MSTSWFWDEGRRQYRRWDGEQWIWAEKTTSASHADNDSSSSEEESDGETAVEGEDLPEATPRMLSPGWEWDQNYGQGRRWNGTCWVLQDGRQLIAQAGGSVTRAALPDAAQSTRPTMFPSRQVSHSPRAPSAMIAPVAVNKHTAAYSTTRKRVLLSFDGTDNIPQDQTNVWRIHALFKEGNVGGGIVQEKHYWPGLKGLKDKILGTGIKKILIEAYLFLRERIQSEQDEIILTGFSRGAYTAWCLAGALSDIGLRPCGGSRQLIEDWANDREKGTFQGPRTPRWVKAIALWAPVSSNMGAYKYVRGSPPSAVQNVFHALSLHEHRWAFDAEIWRPVEHSNTKVCWFPGYHLDIGGHKDNKNQVWQLTLCWMLDQLDAFVSIDQARLWHDVMLALHVSGTGFDDKYSRYFLFGHKSRHPGEIKEGLDQTAKVVDQFNQHHPGDTPQRIHWSMLKYLKTGLEHRNKVHGQPRLMRNTFDLVPGASWICRDGKGRCTGTVQEEGVERVDGAPNYQYMWLRYALAVLHRANPFDYLSIAAGPDQEIDRYIQEAMRLATPGAPS